MDNKNTTILALAANTRTSADSITDAVKTEATPPTLAESITAPFLAAFCQTATRQRCQTDTFFKLNKDGVFIQYASIDGALWKHVTHTTRTRTHFVTSSPSLRSLRKMSCV